MVKRVNACSLLTIPETQWKIFTILVYFHSLLSFFLFAFGIACFCLGIQYSAMYTEVNCSSGTNIWIPLLNMVASFCGLFAIRTLQLHWPAFIHFLFLWIMSFMLIVTIVYLAVESSRWSQFESFKFNGWAKNFTWIDLSLCIIALLNEVMCIALILLLLKYWYRSHPLRPQGEQALS